MRHRRANESPPGLRLSPADARHRIADFGAHGVAAAQHCLLFAPRLPGRFAFAFHLRAAAKFAHLRVAEFAPQARRAGRIIRRRRHHVDAVGRANREAQPAAAAGRGDDRVHQFARADDAVHRASGDAEFATDARFLADERQLQRRARRRRFR